MTIYNQPDAVAFASDPKPSEIATFTAWARGLGIAFDETSGMPQMEGFNDILNRITQGIKYLEQYGIPLWRSDLEYPIGASVVYNGIQYRCIAQNTNAQPDLSQNSWQSAIVDNLTSTSITQALSANQGKVLADMLKSDQDAQQINKTKILTGSGFTNSNGYIDFIFPASFKSKPRVFAVNNSSKTPEAFSGVASVTTTGFRLYSALSSGVPSGSGFEFTYIAVGI